MTKTKARNFKATPRADASSQERRTSAKVCIVVRDLYTTDAPTDAGSNLLGIAQSMARRGDSVTLVWVPRYELQQKLDQSAREWIKDRFASLYLINFEILVDSPQLSPHISFPEKASLAVYHYLKQTSFDEVFISLEGGLAYYCFQAIELGLYAPNYTLSLLVHTPTEWLAAADKRFIANVPELAVVHMEQYCVENAPQAVFFSQYMKNWVLSKSWRVPTHEIAFPLLPDELLIKPPNANQKRSRRSQRDSNLGFWPGWEYRSGVTFLYDALDELAQDNDREITVNFFGEFSHILGEHTGGMLLRRARSWPFDIRYFPKRTEIECLEYLLSRGGVGVFPDVLSSGSRLVLACLNAGIPVVAAAVGAMPELLSKSSNPKFGPHRTKDLARALKVATSRQKPTQFPSVSQWHAEELWEETRDRLRKNAKHVKTAAKTPINYPLVSIVIAHYDRPQLLAEALRSVEQQDYPNLEVVLVDDGSRTKAARNFLKELEPPFKRKKWKIVRQQNKFLGAARNAGIKACRGEFVLFLDDDNALLPKGISTFVRSTQSSNADICTSVSKIFVGAAVPKDETDGFIEYVPLGGSIDLSLIHDSFGDANAMMKREVFQKIGYLVEDRGFSGSDWGFFTRAAIHGLKVRIIPEATYWYRSSPRGMFRSSHWYDTRLPILKLFKANGFRGLDKVLELTLAQHTFEGEQKSLEYQLRFDRTNDAMLRLAKMDAQSREAIEFLAEIAATEGRPDTALNLLAFADNSPLLDRAWKLWTKPSVAETSISNEPLPPGHEVTFEADKLRQFAIAAGSSIGRQPIAYVEAPDKIFFDVTTGDGVVAALNGLLPPGTSSVSLRAAVDDEGGDQIQLMIAVMNPAAAKSAGLPDGRKSDPILGSGGWHLLDRRYVEQYIEIQLDQPTAEVSTLVLSMKPKQRRVTGAKTRVRLRRLSYFGLKGLSAASRPRLGPPPDRLQSRPLAPEELLSAKVATRYPGVADLIEHRPSETGFLLHPYEKGPVVAVMQWAFPPFARSLVATVEIANDEAGPFDFALALVRPTYLGDWSSGSPSDALAFSGWHRVARRFELNDIVVSLLEPYRFHLGICAAIRVPSGTRARPDDTFWRKFVIRW